MKNLSKYLLSLGMVSLALVGCKDFVEDIDDPIDVITDEILTDEAQVPFVTTGVYGRMAITHDQLTVGMALLSDQFIFDDQVDRATFPTYREIDTGNIPADGNTSDAITTQLNQARFFADNLIERVDAIGTFDDAAVRDEALFAGYFVGGITRYWLGASFGLTETTGGAPIDNSAIISSADLYADAITRLTTALTHTSDVYMTKVVNSLIGKLHLYSGNYSAAATSLAAGLVSGDAPYQSLHSNESANEWMNNAGRSRTQFVVAPRVIEIVTADPEEAGRMPIEVAPPGGSWTGDDFYRQALYTSNDASINIITWQEVSLMIAECTLRGSGSADVDALVNAVRTSHGITTALTGVTLADLFEERYRELFTTENRTIDQRRESTVGWHIQEGGTYSTPSIDYAVNWTPWQYLPVSSRERNNNPNL